MGREDVHGTPIRKKKRLPDLDFQIEKTKSIRVTTSLAGDADHSVRSELPLNLHPVNGGSPSFATAKPGFTKAASRG